MDVRVIQFVPWPEKIQGLVKNLTAIKKRLNTEDVREVPRDISLRSSAYVGLFA